MTNKLNYILPLLFILFLNISCGSKQVAFFPTSELTYQSYTGDILNVRVLGYGVNENAAIEDAQIRAIETLFFRGIPNSSISKPLVSYNEKTAKQKNPAYFNEFFGSKKFLTYISESIFVGGQKQKVIATKINKKQAKQEMVDALVVAVDVLINVKPLRKDLEQNNIIRKFGF
ncbi:hypothetical protein [Polaribacter sp.]|uniref:hypothetical protein n=1 Tax=Polaribacter sp. TaxID=1920175 RepID=UPI003F6AF9DF